MESLAGLIRKGWQIARRRVGEQGLLVTLTWLYGRGLPAITGVPLLQFSRVTPQLFVGPQYRKRGLKLLEREGIHAVVNMRIEKDDSLLGLAPSQYCYLPTVDDAAPSIEHLAKGVIFIDQVIQSGGKVYIHCGAGVGRAPTMAAAYLVSKGSSLDSAIEKIRKVRPFIYIMPPQLEQLRRFEVDWKNNALNAV
jgi:hypothetical protein